MSNTNNLYDAIQRLNRLMHRHRHRMMPPKDGLHRGQIRLLFLILQNDGIIQRDLADIMDMRPSSLTEMLVNLEQNSLITRKQDEKDRRVIHVYLTDAGKAAVEGFAKSNDKLLESIFNCLTTEETEKMLELVNKINTSLEVMDGEDTLEEIEGGGHHCHGHANNRWHKHWEED